MRADSSLNDNVKSRSSVGSRPAARAAQLQKSRLRTIAVEYLEERTLLSTLPASTRPTTPILTLPLVGTQQGTGTQLLSDVQGSESSPSIAIDPNNPKYMAAVWTLDNTPLTTANDPTTQFVEAAISTNGGTTWTSLNVGPQMTDPTTATATTPLPYAQESDASVAFDHNDNLYILYSQHQSSNAIGQLLLTKYTVNGTASLDFSDKSVYSYDGDSAVHPTMTVDGNPSSVPGATNQNDVDSGNIYVSWTQENVLPKNVTNADDDLRIATSSDGGNSFSAPILVPGSTSNVPGNNLGPAGAQLTVLAGSSPNSSASVTPGEVAVAWDQTFTAPATVDSLLSNRLSNAANESFSTTPGTIVDAVKQSSGPDTESPNNYNFNVNITDPKFTTLSNLSVTVNLTDTQMSGIQLVLVPPTGSGLQSITLVNNQEDGTGTAITPAQGISGANLGTASNAPNFGTTFTQTAIRSITDGSASAPYIGDFKPEAGSLASYNGSNAAKLNGNWTLEVNVIHDAGSNGFLNSASLNFTSGMTLGSTATIGNTPVMGNLAETGFITAAPVTPQGIGPGLAIAADDTLGNNSAHQGRIYATYVTHDTGTYVPVANPADNTDIAFAYSDNGGQSWTTVTNKLNDDQGTNDGFSSANGTAYGRPQFQPEVTVDNATGTVVVSWFDARNDPSSARVAVYTTTSIDGGQTFSPDVFVSPAQTATDAITGKTVVLGPIPENESGGNADTVNGYGTHQGLAAYDGKIYAVWGSNLNGDNQFVSNDTQPTPTGLQIRLGTATFDAGPRVISPQEGVYSTNFASDGTPEVTSFTISFDRPVNPASVQGAITAFYQDTTSGDAPIQLTINSVTLVTNALGATSATVNVAPLSTAELNTTGGVGTYYYDVSTALTDQIETITSGGTTTGNPLDQLDANAATAAGAAYPTPFAISPDVNGTQPIIVPGPHVVGFEAVGASASATTAANDVVLNGTVSEINVTFDRDMNPGSFNNNSILQLIGPEGTITGPFTYIGQVNTRTYTFGFPTQTLSGTYSIVLNPTMTDTHGNALDSNENAGLDVFNGTVTSTTTIAPVVYNAAPTLGGQSNLPTFTSGSVVSSVINVPDNYTAQINPTTGQGVTVEVDLTYPADPDLQLSLIPPPGLGLAPIILVERGTGSGGTGADFQDTVFDDTASTPIGLGEPPFFGRFEPQTPLNGLATSHVNVNGAWTLQIDDNSGNGDGLSGVLNSWSITFQKGTPSSGLGQPVADQATVGFRIFTMSPTNQQSSTTWTAIGPAASGGLNSFSAGSASAIAVDPSDPSGNTVYAGGSSGGVWKTTNFLTTDPGGPTWIPLTDAASTYGLDIGSITVLGRNNDPTQSIVIVGTGDGNSTYNYGNNTAHGVGFLISTNGGSTWSLSDSSNNNLAFNARDHVFDGMSTMKVVVDPHLTPTGQAIIYAAMSGTNGGLWRSTDTGQTWQNLSSSQNLGNCTDITLDYQSATIDAVSNPTGNVNTIYAAFPGSGVYISPDRGQVLNPMNSIGYTPNIVDTSVVDPRALSVSNDNNPTGVVGGRIVLARPAVNPAWTTNEKELYEGWLYAAVTNADGTLNGVYMTKDNGQNWVTLQLPSVPYSLSAEVVYPTNDTTQPETDPLASHTYDGGSYALALTVDPTNPNVIYLGGTTNGFANSGLIRIDTTLVSDSHALVAYNPSRPDGGLTEANTTGRLVPVATTPLDLYTPYINLLQDPTNPFQTNSVYGRYQIGQSFTNDGSGVTWTPVLGLLDGISNNSTTDSSTNIHQMISEVDPLTGYARILIADDDGIFSGVDDNGTLVSSLGTTSEPSVSRNGNLQLAQLYTGAVEPSSALATEVGNLVYGNGYIVGQTSSTATVLSSGAITGTADKNEQSYGEVDGTGVAVGVGPDVNTPSETDNYVYRFMWPGFGGAFTNFFQVSINGSSFIGRTNGLLQTTNDPQWPTGYTQDNGVEFGNFAVNPVDGDQVIISSNVGRIFSTSNAGQSWLSIGEPSALDSSYADALAFGAPDPNGPAGVGNLNNFLYAGTVDGHIFVTQTGGGTYQGGNAWTNISAGLDGSPVMEIVTDPTRGSHDAYAVTQKGVYYMANSLAANATWVNITGNLFSIELADPLGNASYASPALTTGGLTSLQADWRYVIPNSGTTGTHPILYVAGNTGVYTSIDNGATWSLFPSLAIQGGPSNVPTVDQINGGYLPDATVTDLSMSTGAIDPTTGRAVNVSGDPNVLVASTFGRGQYAIRLAPIVLPNSASTNPTNLYIDSSTLAGVTSPTDLQYTTVATPTFDGTSEQTAFGNTVTVSLFDVTNGIGSPVAIPLSNGNGVSVTTDVNGKFSVKVAPGYFTKSGTYTIAVQATDAAGEKGNLAILQFVINLGPPPPPTNVVLDALSDSGTSDSDGLTRDNNAQFPAPVFDVSGIEVGASVVLLRASEVNGVVGPFVPVDTVTNTAGGTVQIADTNGGNGQIPDNPTNSPYGPPPQPNQYIYSAYQIDPLGTASTKYVPSTGTLPGTPVIIDTSTPQDPTGIILDPGSDSGPSDTDNYTNANNTAAHPAPVFDVSGIEAGATVVLLRGGVVVGETKDAVPTGMNNTVQVADTNLAYGGGQIPDSPLGIPIDTLATSNPYQYAAYQISLSGVVSGVGKPLFGNAGAVVIDGTDADNHGDDNGPGGTVENGWLYMKEVLDLIRPNITDGQKVLVALGPNPATGSSGGGFGGSASSTLAIYDSFEQSSLPGQGWSLVYVTGTTNISNYLSGQAATAVTESNAAAGTITLGQTGFMYITTAGHVGDDLTQAELGIIDENGPAIANYVNAGGGLYTQTESSVSARGQSQTSPSYGWLSAVFPGLNQVSVASQTPTGFTVTAAGAATFPSLTAAQVSAGPWHNYFEGNFGPLETVMTATDTDATDTANYGTQVALILTSAGGVGGNTSALGVVIDSTPPVAPVLTLDTSTDTGRLNNDAVTQDNNGKTYPSPIFDATNVEPNATVNLYRVLLVNGIASGQPILVNTATQGATAAPATFKIADTNGGNGVIADGTYQYSVTQTDLAGNVSPIATLTVVIKATPPPAPTPFKLETGSDTGTFDNDGVTKDNNGVYPAPIFDASGIVPEATVELFRQLITTTSTGTTVGPRVLVNSVVSAAGGLVPIADDNNNNGAIPNGSYIYSTEQVDLAGNVSTTSGAVTVTIDALPPQANPPSIPVLQASSDSGTFDNDDITQDNNGNPYPAPAFNAGSASNPVEAGATVTLLRQSVGAGGVVGNPVVVNTITDTNGGIVGIADTNGGNGKIPDGQYIYKVQLTSLAGVIGTASQGLLVTIDATNPATPSGFRLDPASDTGYSSSDGITQITLRAQPVFDVGIASGTSGNPILAGATLKLYRAPVVNGVVGSIVLVNTATDTTGGLETITDPSSPPPVDGVYDYWIQQIDLAGNASPAPTAGSSTGSIPITYVTAQPATPSTPILDASNPGNPAGNTTSSTNPVIDTTVSLTTLEAGSSVTLVRDGTAVYSTTYTANTGTVKITDPGPVTTPGVHTYRVYVTDKAGNVSALSGTLTVTFSSATTASLVLDPGSDSGTKGDDITNVTDPTFDVSSVPTGDTVRLLRNGVVVTNAVTAVVNGVTTVTDPGLLNSATYLYTAQLVDSHGNAGPVGPALSLTVDLSTPVTVTGLTLDPSSQSGSTTPAGVAITNDNQPEFDVTGATPKDFIELLRGGTVVATTAAVPASGSITVTDPGASQGTYAYTVEQLSPAGNTGLPSSAVSVEIITTAPAAPTLSLDPASNSGGAGGSTNVTSPFIDASGAIPGDTIKLYRGSTLIATDSQITTTIAKIQDPGPLANGTYSYTAVQIDPAGNVSATSTPLAVIINTSAPASPTTPTNLALAASSDTGIVGDDITTVRRPVFTGHADANITVNLYNGTQLIGTTTSNSIGSFSVGFNALAGNLSNGTYQFHAQSVNSKGVTSSASSPVTIKIVTVQGDFIGDGVTQPAIYKQTSSTLLQWFVLYDAQINGRGFGASSTDVPIVGDFTGDGRMDLMTYTPSTGNWNIESPANNYIPTLYLKNFGSPAGYYIPAPADYAGIGKLQVGVFETTTGKWFINTPTGGTSVSAPIIPFKAGDEPVPGNYDNTGKDELAVYRPSNATWYISGPSGVHSVAFGGNGDIPEPGAYYATPTSQAVTEAVWRPSTSSFLIRTPNGGTKFYTFQAGDIPAPGDYDGIGMTEPAVYRPSTGEFLVWGPNDTAPRIVQDGQGKAALIGGSNYLPLTSPYQFRALQSGGGLESEFASKATATVTAGSLDLGSTAASLSTATKSTPVSSSVKATAVVAVVPPSLPNQSIVAPTSTTTFTSILSSLFGNRKGSLFNRLP